LKYSASISRVVERNERRQDLHYAIIGGVLYVALEPIPGARALRRKKDEAVAASSS